MYFNQIFHLHSSDRCPNSNGNKLPIYPNPIANAFNNLRENSCEIIHFFSNLQFFLYIFSCIYSGLKACEIFLNAISSPHHGTSVFSIKKSSSNNSLSLFFLENTDVSWWGLEIAFKKISHAFNPPYMHEKIYRYWIVHQKNIANVKKMEYITIFPFKLLKASAVGLGYSTYSH